MWQSSVCFEIEKMEPKLESRLNMGLRPQVQQIIRALHGVGDAKQK